MNPMPLPAVPLRRPAPPRFSSRVIFRIWLLLLAWPAALTLATNTSGLPPDFFQHRGQYFPLKSYSPKPLPKFAETRDKLPSPIFDEDPACVDLYWKAWELAFRHFNEPASGSGFVSQFIDAAFNKNIFLWDTCFMTMFCNYGAPYVPGIGSLDNFYCKQFADGEICREIERATGRDVLWLNTGGASLHSLWGTLTPDQPGGPHPFTVDYVGRQTPQPPPHLTLDALNHPLLAWAELESYRVTADRRRLAMVYEPLVRYYRALQKYLRQGNGLYVTDWASMDNSPRNIYLDRGGMGVDISAEMVLFANQLSRITDLLGKPQDAAGFRTEAGDLARVINEKMWDPKRQFYFDLKVDGTRAPTKTVAAYWTLLAGVADPAQAEALARELRNPKTFGRRHRVPTVSGDDPQFSPLGNYWCGSVWAPTNTMVIRGLEESGHPDLAEAIALEHLRAVTQVFKQTGTIWENYAPDAMRQGSNARKDFVGWSALAPIMYLIEYGLGIRVDAPANTLTWHLRSPKRVGIERLRFGNATVSLLCKAPDARGRRTVHVMSDAPFHLKLLAPGLAQAAEVPAGQPLLLHVGPLD